jgi:hypothetical protein
VRSTTLLGAFRVNRCRLRHRCAEISRAQAPAAAAVWKRMALNFLVLQRRLLAPLWNCEVRTENRKSVVD